MSSITSHCRIKDNVIGKDGQAIETWPGISLDEFLVKAYDQLKISYPKFYKMDRLSRLGFLGSEVLVSDQPKSENTAVILSNSSSSLDTDLKFWDSNHRAASPSLFVYTLPNIVAGEICIRNGFKGEGSFFVMPSFDPSFMSNYVELVLSSGDVDSCLAGWVDILGDQAEVFLYLAVKTGGGICAHSAKNVRELYHGRISSKS